MSNDRQLLIGQKILVGLTYLDTKGEVVEQKQLHGNIISVSNHTLSFALSSGTGNFSIPFDGELDEANPEAVYKLRTTGEAITGVHFLATYTINPPAK